MTDVKTLIERPMAVAATVDPSDPAAAVAALNETFDAFVV